MLDRLVGNLVMKLGIASSDMVCKPFSCEIHQRVHSVTIPYLFFSHSTSILSTSSSINQCNEFICFIRTSHSTHIFFSEGNTKNKNVLFNFFEKMLMWENKQIWKRLNWTKTWNLTNDYYLKLTLKYAPLHQIEIFYDVTGRSSYVKFLLMM